MGTALAMALGLGLGLWLRVGTLAAEDTPGPTASLEQSIRQAWNVPADVLLEYQDEAGKPLDADAFALAASTPGKTLAVSAVDKKRGRMVVRLRPGLPRASVPSHLPALEARDLTGRPVRHLDLAGKHTLLNFYFSDCAPCVQEVPALNAFREANPELNYLAITFDPAADARRFVSERKLSWPVVADAGRFLRAAGVRSFPGYMLVAPDGRILGYGQGLAFGPDEETPGLAALQKFVGERLKEQK